MHTDIPWSALRYFVTFSKAFDKTHKVFQENIQVRPFDKCIKA